MNLKQTTISNRKKIIVITLCCLVVIAGLVVADFVESNMHATAKTTTITKPTKQMVIFTGAADWRQGPTNETSMALFSKAAADGTSACFTSIEYKKGTIDIAAALQQNLKTQTANNNTVTPMATQTLTLQTTSGDKAYELHQYKTVSTQGEKLMAGNEIGYLQLSGGYVEILGNCNSEEELPSTLVAFRAYKLDISK